MKANKATFCSYKFKYTTNYELLTTFTKNHIILTQM